MIHLIYIYIYIYIYFVIGLKTCLVHRNDCYLNEIVSLIYQSSLSRLSTICSFLETLLDIYIYIILTKTAVAQKEAALGYHRVRGHYFWQIYGKIVYFVMVNVIRLNTHRIAKSTVIMNFLGSESSITYPISDWSVHQRTNYSQSYLVLHK